MEQVDYYQVLGINKDANEHQIKDSYRKLALKYHPDRNSGDPDAAEKMKSINEAYAVLSNPQKRHDYDLLKERYGSSAYNHFRQNYSEQDIFTGSDINGIFEELARSFGLRGFDEIFREAYGNGFKTFEFRQDGFNGKGYVFTGTFGRGNGEAVPSQQAGQLGKMARYLFKRVTGVELPEAGRDIVDFLRLSPDEASRGGVREYMHWRQGKKLKITVPPGIKDGQKIRLAGMGEPGKSGGEPGDLYLKVHIKKPLIREIKNFIAKIGR